jgi:hypothetical protein
MSHETAKMSGLPGAAEPARLGKPKRDLKARLIREAKSLLVIFVYLWVLFGLFALHESLVLAQHGIKFEIWGVAAGNALVFAKVMVVVEALNLARGVAGRPLMVPVLYKSVVFAIAFIFVHIAEKFVIGLAKGKTLAGSFPSFGSEGMTGMLIAGIIVAVSLTPFFAFTEVERELGRGALRDLFLAKQSKAGAAAPH